MKDPTASARDDLAFIRALVSDSGRIQTSTGTTLLAGGLCFGTQALAQFLLHMLPAGLPGRDWGQLIGAVVPSLIFILVVIRVTRRDRRNKVGEGEGVASRAFRTAFGAAGLSIFVTAAIFGYLAATEHDMTIWLYHPIMVCVAQGIGWYMAFAVRRRHWFALISGSWFVCAFVLATLLHQLGAFILVFGLALYALMAVPGWALLRSARGG